MGIYVRKSQNPDEKVIFALRNAGRVNPRGDKWILPFKYIPL